MASILKPKLIIGMLLVLTLTGLLIGFNINKSGAKTSDYMKVKRQNIVSTITGTGIIISENTSTVKAELSGKIVLSNYKEGDAVKQGDIVAKFNEEDFETKVKQAEVSHLNAKNKIDNIKEKEIPDAREKLKQSKLQYSAALLDYDRAKKLIESNVPANEADENLNRAKLNYEKSLSEYDNAKKLFDDGVISENEFINYKYSMELSKSSLKTAQAQRQSIFDDDKLNKAKFNMEIAQSNLQIAETSLKTLENGGSSYESALLNEKQSQVLLEDAILNLDKTVIKAPINGVIVKRLFEPGDNVTSGQNLLMIADDKNLKVKASLDEKYIPRLKVGQKVILSIDNNNKSFNGVVERISPAVEAQNGTIDITVSIENQPFLKINMAINMEILTSDDKEQLAIESRFFDPQNNAVYVLEEGKVKVKKIDVGVKERDTIIVNEGLREGDILLMPGIYKDGEYVKLKE